MKNIIGGGTELEEKFDAVFKKIKQINTIPCRTRLNVLNLIDIVLKNIWIVLRSSSISVLLLRIFS